MAMSSCHYMPHQMVGRSAAGMGYMRCTGSEKWRSHAKVRVRMPEKGTLLPKESLLRLDSQCVLRRAARRQQRVLESRPMIRSRTRAAQHRSMWSGGTAGAGRPNPCPRPGRQPHPACAGPRCLQLSTCRGSGMLMNMRTKAVYLVSQADGSRARGRTAYGCLTIRANECANEKCVTLVSEPHCQP